MALQLLTQNLDSVGWVWNPPHVDIMFLEVEGTCSRGAPGGPWRQYPDTLHTSGSENPSAELASVSLHEKWFAIGFSFKAGRHHSYGHKVV